MRYKVGDEILLLRKPKVGVTSDMEYAKETPVKIIGYGFKYYRCQFKDDWYSVDDRMIDHERTAKLYNGKLVKVEPGQVKSYTFNLDNGENAIVQNGDYLEVVKRESNTNMKTIDLNKSYVAYYIGNSYHHLRIKEGQPLKIYSFNFGGYPNAKIENVCVLSHQGNDYFSLPIDEVRIEEVNEEQANDKPTDKTMKKYKLTDEWPEPLKGLIAKNKWTAFDHDYIVEYGSLGVIATFSSDFVESNPDLFEPVRDVEFSVIGLTAISSTTTKVTITVSHLLNKMVPSSEIVRVLNEEFNKP